VAHHVSLRQLYTLFAHAGVSLEQWIITQQLDDVRSTTFAITQNRE
jgi:hypothetical protein